MFDLLMNIDFSWWWMSFAFPIMPVYYFYNYRKNNTSANAQSIHLPFSDSLEAQSLQISSNFNAIDFAFKLLAWSLLILALMRPQLPFDTLETPTTGRDLFMVIDVSGSMREQDMILNNRRVRRMDAVKLIASDFLRQREGDRVGLVFFGKHIATQAPLTFDVKTVAKFIENVQFGDLDDSQSGTVIGDALATTIGKLRDADIKNKVVILLTDGEDQGSTRDPIEMANIAKKSDIKIYTIGVSAYQRGVDEKTLQNIAKITDGQYFRARNTFELQAIYKAIDKLEPNEMLAPPVQPKKDFFFLPASLALILIFIPFVLNFIRTKLFKEQEQK